MSVGLISSVLIDVMVCVDCIVKQTGVPASRVHAALATIGTTVKVDGGQSRCSACKAITQVFQLT